MIRIEGLHGISARILADSIASTTGVRFITFEITYPRLILAELNTHRMLPKNSASSRAIPFAKMQEQLTGRPVRFGQANPGMQDKGEDYDYPVEVLVPNDGYESYTEFMSPEAAWDHSRALAAGMSLAYYKAGYHKQVYNRLTEAYQMMKTVISGTEWNNFFWLRDDVAADPTIAELARVMREAKDASTPIELQPGQWHLPYLCQDFFDKGNGVEQHFYLSEDYALGDYISLEDAKKASAARCAAVSFRNTDYNLEKCLQVFDRLVGDERKHASAFEHQATPMQRCDGEINLRAYQGGWEPGITHMDRDGDLWSGPLRGWIQFRKLIPGENVPG